MPNILERLGFGPAAERGMEGFVHSSKSAEWGTFRRFELNGIRKTTAIDERGDVWVRDGDVDLRQYGFSIYHGRRIKHLFDGLRFLGVPFWRGFLTNIPDSLAFLIKTVFIFFTDLAWFVLTPKSVKERWEEDDD